MEANERLLAALKAKDYEEAERLAIEWIQSNPTHPHGWISLGEVLLQRQQGLMAKLMFRRGRLLDPEGAWLNIVAARAKGCPEGARREELLALLRVPRRKVTAAIVVKNEERCIGRCIESLEGAVDEIVVVDSGSTDGTLDIVRRYPSVKLYETEWKNSFAELRNDALRHITGDWVIWIDADEWLHPDDKHVIRETAGLFEASAVPKLLVVWHINKIEDDWKQEFIQPRMFALRHGFRYRGRVSDRAALPEGEAFEYAKVRIRVYHDGFDPEVIRSKQNGEQTLRLGKEYWKHQRFEEALEVFLKAEPYGGTEVQIFIVRCLLALRRFEEAEERCSGIVERHPDLPDALYYSVAIHLARMGKQLSEAEKYLKEAGRESGLSRSAITSDLYSVDWKSGVMLADLAVQRGELAQAIALFRAFDKKRPNSEYIRKRLAFLKRQRDLLITERE